MRIKLNFAQKVDSASQVRHEGDYAVIDVTIVRAMTLNGEDLPAQELAASTDAWQGVPFTLRHPKPEGEDSYASASDPRVQDQHIGFIDNPVYTNGALRAEAWIRKGHSEFVDGIIAAMEADGLTIDVSSGYFAEVRQNGEGNPTQHNIRPDHVALLPDEPAACSIDDGCGANRVNSAEVKEEFIVHDKDCECQEVKANEDAMMADEGTEEGIDDAAEVEEEAQPDAELEATDAELETNSDEADDEAVADEPVADTSGLRELASLIQSIGGADAVMAALQSIKANADAERASLVDEITANSAFEADELAGFDVDTLRKLATTVRPANFAGRANTGKSAEAVPAGEWFVFTGAEGA